VRRGEHLGPRVDTMVNIRSTWVLLPSLIKRARLSREILEQHADLICRSGCPRKQPEMKEGRGPESRMMDRGLVGRSRGPAM